MENEGHEHEHCDDCGRRRWRHRWKRHHHHSLGGGIWVIGWLFTIGYLKLAFWQGVLAIIIWPYYLGAALSIAR